jgi:hypothetical protein
MSKDEDFVPSKEEIEEAGKSFKVKKGPRYMTAEQVRDEAVARTYNAEELKQPAPIEEDENGDNEAWAAPREPHKPRLEDGKRYKARITKMEVLTDQPVWNQPDKKQTVLVYTFDIGGIEIKRRVTKATGQMSNLYKLALEFGFPNIDITGFDGRKLLGKTCKVKIRHSKPTQDGSIFDNIDVDSVEALEE